MVARIGQVHDVLERSGWVPLSVVEVAQAVGDCEHNAAVLLDHLWKAGKIARIPNRVGKGYLWRPVKSAEDRLYGFTYDPAGQPRVKRRDG